MVSFEKLRLYNSIFVSHFREKTTSRIHFKVFYGNSAMKCTLESVRIFHLNSLKSMVYVMGKVQKVPAIDDDEQFNKIGWPPNRFRNRAIKRHHFS